VYVWADGVFLQARMEDHGECKLVLIGATPEGKKELIGFQVGEPRSACTTPTRSSALSPPSRVLRMAV
jgi:transposase-like protein